MAAGASSERVDVVCRRRRCGAHGRHRLLSVPAADRLPHHRQRPQRAYSGDALAAAVLAGRGHHHRPLPLRLHLRALADTAPRAHCRRALRSARNGAALVRTVRHRLRHCLPGDHLGDGRPRRRAEMDRQFRHPDPDLRDARLGAQHRGRARRPARPRLRRLLRRRRLFLRPARQGIRLYLLAALAARRHPRLVLGYPARLSGVAAARRLSRHRHAWPLARSSASSSSTSSRSPTATPASPAFRGRASSACRSTPRTTASTPSSASNFRRCTASSSSIT